MMSDPEMDDLLQLGSALMAQHPAEMARLVGLGLKIKAIADAHPEAHIPAGSTLWDELLDVIAKIAHVKDTTGGGGILEDLFASFAQDSTVPLQKTFASFMQFKDSLTYNHGSTSSGLSNAFNGTAWNLASGDTQPLHVPVDRTQPDVGPNQSALQRFMQLLHDANGLDVCTKAGAVAHVQLDVNPLGVNLGTINFDYPTNALTGLACAFVGAPAPPASLPQCGILRIPNVDALLLDVVLDRATFDIRDPCLKALMNSSLASFVGGVDQFLQTQSGIAGFDTHPTVPGVGRLVFFDTPFTGLPGNPDPGGDTNPNTMTTVNFLTGILDPVGTTVCNPTPFTDSDGTVLEPADVLHLRRHHPRARPRVPLPARGVRFRPERPGARRRVRRPRAGAALRRPVRHARRALGDAQQPKTQCDPSLTAHECPLVLPGRRGDVRAAAPTY